MNFHIWHRKQDQAEQLASKALVYIVRDGRGKVVSAK